MKMNYGVQVFHELARHLQTRRLIAGDSISLDQDKSFYCIIDGMVQVYAKTGQATEGSHHLWDDEDMNGYQLMNEVGAGGTLSSLFTILSLFTEDVKMSWQDDGLDTSSDEGIEQQVRASSPFSERMDHDVSHLDLEHSNLRRRQSSLSSASTVQPPSVSHYSSARSAASTTRLSRPQTDSTPAPAHRAVVARALEDTTLAVIPAEAFRRLTKKYPKATGHVVQGIYMYHFLFSSW